VQPVDISELLTPFSDTELKFDAVIKTSGSLQERVSAFQKMFTTTQKNSGQQQVVAIIDDRFGGPEELVLCSHGLAKSFHLEVMIDCVSDLLLETIEIFQSVLDELSLQLDRGEFHLPQSGEIKLVRNSEKELTFAMLPIRQDFVEKLKFVEAIRNRFQWGSITYYQVIPIPPSLESDSLAFTLAQKLKF